MKDDRLILNYIYNTSYQILVLLAPLITTPYISRILGVTNIGIYQYAQSIARVFVIIGAVGTSLYGQREIAYLQKKSEARSRAFWEIEVFRVFAVLVCTVLYYFVFCIHGDYIRIHELFILEVVATAFDITWFFMGMENFKIIVLRNALIKIIGIICIFIFVKTKHDLGIYTICTTLPIIIGNLTLWPSLRKYLVKITITAKDLVFGIIKRLKPIFLLFIPQIAIDVYLLLDKTMLGILGSDIDQVGYYSQADKVVRIILMIVTSLGTVMLPTMSANFSEGRYDKIVSSLRMAFRFIYMLSFALLFGLLSIVSRFVPLFYGSGYNPVINLIVIISPVFVIVATSNVIGKQYLLPTKQQRAFTMSVISGAVINFLLNMIFIPLWDAIGASIATVIAEFAVTIVQCFYVRKQIPLVPFLMSGIKYFFLGSIMLAVVSAIGNILPDGRISSIMIMVFVGIVCYMVELLVVRDQVIVKGIDLTHSFFHKRETN